MAITYPTPNQWTNEAITAAGHDIWVEDGVWRSTDGVAVQAIIDSHDPLPQAQAEAERMVKLAADRARSRYADPAKSEIYRRKEQEATDYLAAVAANGGAELADTSAYPFLVVEQAARGLATVSDAATWILSVRDQWIQVMVAIEQIARPAVEAARAGTDWQTVMADARTAAAQLDAV